MKKCKNLTIALVITTVLASAAAAQKPDPVWIQDSHVLVVVPENRKVVTAYSCLRGIWSKIELSKDSDVDVNPAVNGEMVALKRGRTIYAYSAHTTSWDSIVLQTDTDAMFSIGENAITVKDGHSLCIFGAHAQAWSVIDLRTGDSIDIARRISFSQPSDATDVTQSTDVGIVHGNQKDGIVAFLLSPSQYIFDVGDDVFLMFGLLGRRKSEVARVWPVVEPVDALNLSWFTVIGPDGSPVTRSGEVVDYGMPPFNDDAIVRLPDGGITGRVANLTNNFDLSKRGEYKVSWQYQGVGDAAWQGRLDSNTITITIQ